MQLGSSGIAVLCPLLHDKSMKTGVFFFVEFDVPVTQEERITASKLVLTVWRDIGAMLGFESHELNSFQKERHDRDGAQAMLDTWAHTRGKSATRRNLIEVLIQNGYATQVSEIFPGKSNSNVFAENRLITYGLRCREATQVFLGGPRLIYNILFRPLLISFVLVAL